MWAFMQRLQIQFSQLCAGITHKELWRTAIDFFPFFFMVRVHIYNQWYKTTTLHFPSTHLSASRALHIFKITISYLTLPGS